MLEIKFTENVIPVKINYNEFMINGDDLSVHSTLSDFIQKYKGNRLVTAEFTDDCKKVIETVLGEGSYQKLFKKDDLKPYYVILRLAEVIQDKFIEKATTEKMIEQKHKAEKDMQNVQGLIKEFGEFTKQVNYTENKYGLKNVVNKKRSSKKHFNRK